jgi:hypothetical protein
MAEFVAGEDHRRTLGEQKRRHHVAAAARAGGEDGDIGGFALDAHIVGKFSLWPSRLSSPLASLCLWL